MKRYQTIKHEKPYRDTQGLLPGMRIGGDCTIKTYNKAVRDKIPDIIEQSGRRCEVERLDDAEFLQALEAKLKEETDEYLRDRSVDELADILEVIGRILEIRQVTAREIEDIRLKKRTERGGFGGNLFLASTE